MKNLNNIFILFLIAILANGCAKSETFGKALSEAAKTPAGAILSDPARFDGKSVKVGGAIVTECPSGCWFEMKEGGAILYVDIAPEGLAIPQRVGKNVTVEGVVDVKDGRAKIIGKGVEIK